MSGGIVKVECMRSPKDTMGKKGLGHKVVKFGITVCESLGYRIRGITVRRQLNLHMQSVQERHLMGFFWRWGEKGLGISRYKASSGDRSRQSNCLESCNAKDRRHTVFEH